MSEISPARTLSIPGNGGDGQTVEVNGATLYYEDHGPGTPVVLIHAGLVSSAMWGPLLPELGVGFA